MRKLLLLQLTVFSLFLGLAVSGQNKNKKEKERDDDADLPALSKYKSKLSKEDFMIRRDEAIARLRGIEKDKPLDPRLRQEAIRMMEQQKAQMRASKDPNQANLIDAAWTPIGPAPIPNGQVASGPSTPVSGRTSAIAVHPTNPNIAYAGTAQGGIYRTTDGGTNWTPIFDGAASLAIGAIAISPSSPEIVYVGTGEATFSASSFFGVGVYRINNASTTANVSGPFRLNAANADIFSGRAIGRIIVHPTNPDIIFVASTSGVGGILGNSTGLTLPSRGIYRCNNATTANPVFAKLTGLLADLNVSVRDIAIDPTNPDILIANPIAGGVNQGGIYRTTNALAADPTLVTFTQTHVVNSTSTSELVIEFAAIHLAGPDATFYAASGVGTGRVQKSTDGGLTWTQTIANNFCGGQCFYDVAVAVDPTNANTVYLGGSPNLVAAKSTDGGVSFTDHNTSVHVDTHVLTVSPSNPLQVWLGTDGGIYKSLDAGLTWTNLNNSQYSATQFMSLALHPTDPVFSIGGTQDNGTNFINPSSVWTRAEGGDGGYTQIDQNAVNTTTVRMYHTFFNATNLQGYSTTNTPPGGWGFRGCQTTGATVNGITCNGSINFYAPLERGPGNPNTIYYGSDRLYRSADEGLNHTVVSQNPIAAGVPISAIGISPQNDNVRIVGLNNGGLFGTSTGSSTLVDLDPGNTVPNNLIARTVIDPNSQTTAYVTLSAFNVAGIWKTTNLNAATPTWTAAATGLPQVPVDAIVIDPANSNNIYVGTDIGVYASTNGGTSWAPFGTGLPVVAVFGIGITASPKKLRIATHGRGMWDNPLTAANPNVTINQAAAQPDPTSVSPINFTVVFDQPVINFTTGDVTLSGTAGATTATVTPPGGSGTTFNVAVTGMATSGTVIATIAAGVCTNAALDPNNASTSTDNTVTYNLPATPPTVTINQAAAQPDPTSTSPINYTVVFDQPVTGFTTGDVTLSGTAGATTAVVTPPGGSGTIFNVAVSGMTGCGTVIATIPAGVCQNSSAQNNVASTSTDNTVTYFTPNPNVTINQAVAQPDPTSVSPIVFTAVFDQAVTGFTTGDVTLSGTAGATLATVVPVSATTYTINVTGMTASGTVIATIGAGVCQSACPSPNNASTSTDNTVTFNLPPPVCTATFSYTGPAVPIPDNTPAGVNIPITISGAGTIADLNFRFDAAPASTCDATIGNTNAAADHTFIGDLVFTLTSPGATSVILVNRRGGTRENICTTLLDDDGAFPALSTVTSTSGQFLSGNFAPDNPLSAFDGQNANGVWTLNVSDNANIDIGSMRRFSLIITSVVPTVNAVANQTVCAGSPTTAVNFTGTPAGVTFNWSNSNTAIGLAASGSGNIPSFTATNATAAPIVATITVTPVTGTCTGTPITFTITVNPTPVVNAIPNQVVCQNAPTAPVNFTGTPAGVVFQWTNNTPAIGLAASGTGNIASFIAQNPTAAPLVATITVNPVTGLATPIVTTYNFTGAVQTFTVPAGITSINIKSWGAQGNSNAGGIAGGLGGYAEGNLAVTPGQVLNVLVGGGAASSINGGFNGGGAAGTNPGCAAAQAGGGGGASDVRVTPYALANRVIVGAGGGGAGGNRTAGCGRGTGGGGGGGLWGGGGGAGWPGVPPGGPVPTGGTQVAGGAAGTTTWTAGGPTDGFPGVLAVGGAGGNEVASAQGTPTGPAESGGVGGGLAGGSGLYNSANNWNGHSGAGGSSYIGGVTGGITTPGLRTGAGQVQITYTPISAATCFGVSRTFTITVNPNANLIIVADPGTTICEGDPTLLTVFDAGAVTVPGTLYTQGTGVPANGSPSQVFEPANVAFNSQGADDFTVPAGGNWNITQITTSGIGTGAPTSVNVFFYTNSGSNLPGAAIASFTNVTTFTRVGGNYTVTLPSAVSLGAGTYWMSFQVNMSFAAGGQWFWGNFGATNVGNQYAWQNPGGGFATPCTSWGYGATGCNVGGGVNRNNYFSIIGTSVGLGPQSTGTFLWSPAAGLSSVTSNPVAASPMNTTTYTVTRTTGAGCQASAQVTITVNKRPTVTTQPINSVRCVGNTATFTVAGTGTALTYQWQLRTTGCSGVGPWVNLSDLPPYSGTATPVLTVTSVTQLMNGYAYRCVLSGSCAPILTNNISNCVTLSVNPNPQLSVTPPVSCGGVAGISGTLLTASSGAPPVPGNVTVNSGAINVPIPDGTNVAATSNLTVAGVPANATITEVKINMNINHTWVGDVDVNIKAPNAAILNLVAGLDGGTGGNASDNFTNTAFSSLGGLTISGAAAPRTGTYTAEARAGRGPIGFLQTVTTWGGLYTTGASANGVWTLAMGDRVATDVGNLTNWSISIDYTTPGSGSAPVLTYTWAPLGGLYNNSISTIPYLGTNTPTVYAAPVAQTTYTVTATDVATGCFSTATALVNYTPPAPTITPSSVTMCLGDPAVRLVSSSSTPFVASATSGTINLLVPDNTANGVSSNLNIAGIPANGNIANITVTLNMSHTYPGDMIFHLKAPNGQILNLYKYGTGLFTGPASGVATWGWYGAKVSQNGSTAWSTVAVAPFIYNNSTPWKADAINTPVAGAVVQNPTGFVSNAANFGALYTNGPSANGTWTLAMCDGGPGDVGTLASWSLDINYVIGVPSTPAVWTPAAGLFTDPSALPAFAYVAGTPRDTVWTRPTPSGVYTYSATVLNLITTIATPTTPMAGGNGNNLVTFNVKNNNTFPVTFSSISSNTFGSGAVTSTVFYKPGGNAGNPGAISAANGFIQFGTANSTVTAGAMNLLVSGLNLQIPAGATYAIALDMTGATFPAYTNGAATTVTYSNGGCDIITGGNVGWGGPNAPAAPVNNPRNFNGSITFLGSGPGTCQSPARTVVVTVNQPTTVTLQPVNQTVCTDKVATFTVAAGGTGPFSYQWQFSTNGNNPPWNNVINGGVFSGATTATLTITAPPVSLSGNFYRCVITGAAPCAAATSNGVLLTVNPLPSFSISASPYTSLFPGLRTTLASTTIIPAAAATYSWLRDGVVLTSPAAGVVSGLGTGNLLVDVDGQGIYQLRVTDVNGCTNTSNSITIKDSASGRCFIYPNPNSGRFQVRYYSVANNVLPRGIVVYNELGDRVLVQNYTIGRPYDRMDVDMRANGKGLYWVEVVDLNGNRLTMCRVVIQ